MATTAPLAAHLATSSSEPRAREAGDEALAHQVAEASETAFAALYERHHQALYRYCCSILRHEVDAQDALQSAWTRALVALRRGQRDAPVRPWLYRIAHNESVALLRRRRLRAAPAQVDVVAAASAEDRAIERERFALVIDDLQALHPRQRGALLMRELSGLSHDEIAAALGTSVAAAKQSVYEARRDLTEFAAGRATPCEDVCRRISDGDRRALRGRRLLAHLRHCAGCARFAATIDQRATALHVLTPWLPAVAATAVLETALRGHTAASAGAGAAAVTGGGASGSSAVATAGSTAAAGAPAAVATKAIGVSVLGKSLVAVAAVTVGVGSVASVTRSHPVTARPAAATVAAPRVAPGATVPARGSRRGARVAIRAATPRRTAGRSAGSAVRHTDLPAVAGQSARVSLRQAKKASTALPRGQARKLSATPPSGHARKLPATPPPGQVKTTSTPPPGQVKTTSTPPPGQVKTTSTPPPGHAKPIAATPPGQVKKTGTPPPGQTRKAAASTPTTPTAATAAAPAPGKSGTAHAK